jgi:hypothetical protein
LHLFFLYLGFQVGIWDRVSGPGWPQTCNPFISASWILGLQPHPTFSFKENTHTHTHTHTHTSSISNILLTIKERKIYASPNKNFMKGLLKKPEFPVHVQDFLQILNSTSVH